MRLGAKDEAELVRKTVINTEQSGPCAYIFLPHSVGGVTGAVLVTDEAIEAWRTESLLAIRPFKPSFTQTGSIYMVTLGSILTLTPLVTLRPVGAHRTVILTPGGHLQSKDTVL